MLLVSVTRPGDLLDTRDGASRDVVQRFFLSCATRGVGRAVGRGLRHPSGGAGALAALRLMAAADHAGLVKPDAVIRVIDWAVEHAADIDHPPVWAAYDVEMLAGDLKALLDDYPPAGREQLLQTLLAEELATDGGSDQAHDPPRLSQFASEVLREAASSDTASDRLAALATHDSDRVRWHVAANPAASPATLAALLDDDAEDVRRSAAMNAACSMVMLEGTARAELEGRDPALAICLATRPDLSREAFSTLSSHPRWIVRCTVARNAHVPGDARPDSPLVHLVPAALQAQAAGYVPPRTPLHWFDLGHPMDAVPYRLHDAIERLDGWELPIGAPTIRIRLLRSFVELQDNAVRMRNCTTAYDSGMRSNERVVIALDDVRDGRLRHNAELCRQHDGWQLGQVSGVANSADVDSAIAADLDAFVTELLAVGKNWY